jgi:HK97 family phage prohead protease
MSFIIKDEMGNPIIRNGKNLMGLDSAMEIRDLSVERREFTITACTSETDRFGDCVIQEKLDMTNYDNNPIILWSHQMGELPLGKCVSHWIEKDENVSKTKMKIKMADHEFADKVFDLIAHGFLKSASIGFLPLKTEEIPQDGDQKQPLFHNPTKYLESELLETSICNIPANPGCLMAMKSMVENGRLPASILKGLQDGGHRNWKLEAAIDRLGDLEDEDLDDEDLSEILDEIEDDEMDNELTDDFNKAETEALVCVALREALGRLD